MSEETYLSHEISELKKIYSDSTHTIAARLEDLWLSATTEEKKSYVNELISNLAKTSIDITDSNLAPLFCFLGVTTSCLLYSFDDESLLVFRELEDHYEKKSTHVSSFSRVRWIKPFCG